MNTDPRGPEVLAQQAYTALGQIGDPSWPNGLIAVIGGARKRGNLALADKLVSAILNEGNVAAQSAKGLYIATLLKRWPAVPDTLPYFIASRYGATGYGNGASGWEWSCGQQAEQDALNLDCLQSPQRTGRGPDGRYGTADDWYTQTYTAGFAVNGEYLSALRAVYLNLLAMHDCKDVADYTSASLSVADTLTALRSFAAALYALQGEVNALWPV